MNLPANRMMSRMMNRMQKDFDRMDPLMKSDMSCSCEVSEDKSNYTFKFDMPGVNKNDVKIRLDGNVVTVSAERSEEKRSDGKKSRYSEISYGSYQRSFTLPEAVDEDKIDAKFEDGVLTVNLPKTESRSGKEIAVQ